MPPTYCTADDVNAYVIGGTGLDAAALDPIIEFAERDIDRAAGSWAVDFVTGLKFAGMELAVNQTRALNRATCAQVEYRLAKGEQFFIEDQPETLSSPDYSRQGKEPRLGPKAKEELATGGLLRRTVRMR